MKHSCSFFIWHSLRRQSTTMVALLILPLLLSLAQPSKSQVYVNSSSYDGNSRAFTPKQTNQKEPSLGSFQPTGRTEVPFKMGDQGMGSTNDTVNRNVSVEVFKQRDTVYVEKHSISNNTETTSTYPSTTGVKVERTAQHHPSTNITARAGITKTQQPTIRPFTTIQTKQVQSYSENATTEASSTRAEHTSRTVAETEPVTEDPINESSEDDWSTDALIPTVISLVESSPETVEEDAGERAQYKPPAQTAYSILTTVYTAQKHSTVSVELQPKASTTTPVSKGSTTVSTPGMVSPEVTVSLADLQGAKTTISPGLQPKRDSHSPSNNRSTPFGTNTTKSQLKMLPPRETPANLTNPQARTTTQPSKAPTRTNQQPKEAGSNTTPQKRPETKIFKSLPPASTTNQLRPTDMTPEGTTFPIPKGRGRLGPIENEARYVEKDMSISLGSVPSVKPRMIPSTTHISKDPCNPDLGPCSSPKNPDVLSEPGTSNGSLLLWADLSRTLSFAWELHVFGSAALFLLLTAGSALGLALAPGMHCPHRGALALANGLLLLAGVIRAAYFLLDPYGSRLLFPLPVITALYTLPLPLLIWVQAAMVVLILKGAEVTLLPPSLQRPPLLAVLAVLQCTLLLAADLLSPALSPAVPVVLQSLTLTAGLALCLGYLCLVLPRLSDPQAGRAGDKGLSGQKLRVLARVLAVCALLGALCCLLHAYTCLWLYGLLGDWRRFRWTWWLCQFWARLLELAWAFCLLLLASWVFWRPRRGQTQRASGQGGTVADDHPSPCQSSSSSHTHTCWAKIVQSLKGRPRRKSDSNGVGGANGSGVAGELPNNWAGQERSGADISKSLIRNRDPPKENNRGRNQTGIAESSAGSVLRLQALGQHHCSTSGSLDRDKESAISLYDFDLRPPSPIDLSRSIDEALHREHLLRGGSLFHPLAPPSPPPSPGPWMRRNSDPQIMLSDSSDEHTLLSDSSAGLDRSIPSAVPSRQVTAPPTPTHQGPRWVSEAAVPSSISCPVSLHPSPTAGRAMTPSTDDTRPFLTPEIDREGSQSNSRGGRNYLKVRRHDDSASVSSDIIDL